jgi:putative serine protease PepD
MRENVSEISTGFVIGLLTIGILTFTNTNNVPVVLACIDNKSKALFTSINGSCPKGRSAIDIGATVANVKIIAN